MWVLLQTTSAPLSPTLAGGYGAALLQAVLALLAVSVLAWVVLRGLSRGGMLRGTGRIRVLERTPLDARHALVLVQVDGETLLLGLGDGSAPVLIEKLRQAQAPTEEAVDPADGALSQGGPIAPAPALRSARQSFSAALARAKLVRAADSSRDEKNDV